MAKTAYEIRISDWSSDVCSSELPDAPAHDDAQHAVEQQVAHRIAAHRQPSAASAVFAQHGDEEKAQQIHQAVPMHLHRTDMEGDRIELGDVRLRHADRADRAKTKCTGTRVFGEKPGARTLKAPRTRRPPPACARSEARRVGTEGGCQR